MSFMDLNQVTLPCVELEQSVHFYRLLGFTLIVSSPPRYARFECKSGTTFSLELAATGPAEPGVVVYFEVTDLDAEVARLKAAGLTFESDPVDQPWLWREAYIRDPAGNSLCLYSAGDNRRFPPWRL
jgi:hydroxymethylpyrimidine/phosphomethylpyrimidine kinase